MRQPAMRIELLLMIYESQASDWEKERKSKMEDGKRKENSMRGRHKNNGTLILVND